VDRSQFGMVVAGDAVDSAALDILSAGLWYRRSHHSCSWVDREAVTKTALQNDPETPGFVGPKPTLGGNRNFSWPFDLSDVVNSS
jgi:hypothetical protein